MQLEGMTGDHSIIEWELPNIPPGTSLHPDKETVGVRTRTSARIVMEGSGKEYGYSPDQEEAELLSYIIIVK